MTEHVARYTCGNYIVQFEQRPSCSYQHRSRVGVLQPHFSTLVLKSLVLKFIGDACRKAHVGGTTAASEVIISVVQGGLAQPQMVHFQLIHV